MNKDQISKIFLGAILACLALYGYFGLLLGPLSTRESGAQSQIKKLEPQIKDAKSQINRTRAVESGDANAAAAHEIFEVMKASIPEGASVAWFPQRLSEFFKRQGIQKVTYRLSGEAQDSDISGFKNSSWEIDIPEVAFFPAAVAIAGLENQEGLLQITNLQIGTIPANPEVQRVKLTLSTIVKQ